MAHERVFDLFDAKPDSALTTNSLPAKKNPDAISDEATVRTAVVEQFCS